LLILKFISPKFTKYHNFSNALINQSFSEKFYSIIVFEMWYKTFLDKRQANFVSKNHIYSEI